MKLNDIIKKLLTTFSKEVAKDVSKLQKDIVNLKPKSGATPPTSGDYIGQIFAKEDGPTKKLKFWDGTNWTDVSNSQSASEINSIVDNAVGKKFKVHMTIYQKMVKKKMKPKVILLVLFI